MKNKLRTRLSNIVTAVAGRVYPNLAPQGAITPYIVYTTVASERVYTFEGFSDYSKTWFYLKAYATTKAAVEAVIAQAITAIDGWTDSTVNAAFVRSETDGKEENLYYVNLSVEVQHN